jgi:hypothetical protein
MILHCLLYDLVDQFAIQHEHQSMSKAIRTELPAWYHRLVLLSYREDREIDPEDFDEDISELEMCTTCGTKVAPYECEADEQFAQDEDYYDSDNEGSCHQEDEGNHGWGDEGPMNQRMRCRKDRMMGLMRTTTTNSKKELRDKNLSHKSEKEGIRF